MPKTIHDSFPRFETKEQIKKFLYILNNPDPSIGSTISQSTLKNSTHSVSWNQVSVSALETNQVSLKWVSSVYFFNFLARCEIESCTSYTPWQIESTDGVINLLTWLPLKTFFWKWDFSHYWRDQSDNVSCSLFSRVHHRSKVQGCGEDGGRYAPPVF